MWGIKKQTRNCQATLTRTQPAMLNRRDLKEDRREFGAATKFPFIDSSGKLVKVDRRSVPDRRIANISVTEHLLNFDTTIFKTRK